MILRLSTAKDLTNIMNIINEGKEFLKNNNVNQWQDGYPNKEVILNDINNNESYVIENNGEVVGTTAVSLVGEKSYDKIYEGNWLSNNKYAVIHRIAVSKGKGIKGVGREILKESEKICLSNGIRNIKIDTHEDNKVMQELLEKNNYKYCGIIFLEDGSKRLAFEKEF